MNDHHRLRDAALWAWYTCALAVILPLAPLICCYDLLTRKGPPTVKLTDYANLVREMRAAQRLYFSTRTTEALSRARELERRVDQATEKLLTAQRSLFHDP